jgi:tRNA threonylcarbamoyladenosine biosynthesis protein TsaB
MAKILSLETSEKTCSVALSDGTKLLGSLESTDEKSHASMLTVLIDKLLKTHQITMEGLDAVAISKGPGSYTGLRIGVSTAKGICYGLKIPIIAISTLEIICRRFFKTEYAVKAKLGDSDILCCAMIDARRMEVYRQLFDHKVNIASQIIAEEINSNSFYETLRSKKIYFIGSGSTKLKNIINNENAVFIDGIYPNAADMCELAFSNYTQQRFEDVAYFEPYYLKDFVATIPKKKGLSF